MKLKLDENLGHRAGELLRERGHDVATVIGQGLAGTSDQLLAAACQGERRCLVTLDLEFGNPLVFQPSKYSGIAVLRLPSKPGHEDLLVAVETLAAMLSRARVEGKLWIVQRGRVREYQEPGAEGL
jgi:predicted nuclease of predicted toxin-antitoxin system